MIICAEFQERFPSDTASYSAAEKILCYLATRCLPPFPPLFYVIHLLFLSQTSIHLLQLLIPQRVRELERPCLQVSCLLLLIFYFLFFIFNCYE